MKFKHNERVLIKKYRNDPDNSHGRINLVSPKKDRPYWVTNLNMPYQGTVSEFFSEDELEKV